MAIEKIALENIKDIVENDTIETCVHLDPTTAVAYEDSVKAAEHVAEVEDQLKKEAEVIATDAPEESKVKEDNIYTKKITLDESISEFSFSDIDGSKDDDDRYVEFDMFDFIYSLFSSETDSLIRPLKALSNNKGRGRKKAGDTGSSFMYQGSDDYIDETGAEGIAQISTDSDGNIVLYQDNISNFDPVIALCDEYGFRYEGPTPKKAPWVRWNFSFKIFVPTYSDGYPMEVEDYFEQRGIAIEDVMPPEFIKGRARDYKKLNDEVLIDTTFDKFLKRAENSNDSLEIFIKQMFNELDSRGAKYDRKSLKDKFLNEFNDKVLVDTTFDKFVKRAANSNDPLEIFIKQMFNELDSKGARYDRNSLKDKFMDEFNDDFEDEE